MIRHIWTVLCQIASFDSISNNVSLLSILETITPLSTLDAEHPIALQAELVSMWRREQPDQPALGQVRIHFTYPNGVDAPSIVLDLDLSKSYFHRTSLQIPGLLISSTGMYTFKVEYQTEGETDWHLVAEIPLIVATQELPQPA